MVGRSSATDLVRVPAYGPLVGYLLRVREVVNAGRLHEALAEIDVYEWAAAAFGDRTTVEHMIQRRMYTYLDLGQYEAALAVGGQLVARRRAAGDVLGEAKTLADLAELYILTGRLTEGMRYLARSGLLLEGTSLRNERYGSALASYGDAAMAAGLYETAAAFYDEVYAVDGSDAEAYFEDVCTKLLVSWGLWLDHLGHTFEAGQRLRRAATVAGNWLATYGEVAAVADVQVLTGVCALAMAKLGEPELAIEMAQPIVTAMRAGSYAPPGGWMAHLALGVALRAAGDYPAAQRELLAAAQLVGLGDVIEDGLLVQYELAMVNAEAVGWEACAQLRAALRAQAHLIWRQRAQRVTMLHQARQREELEIEHARTNAALLTDPLTGLGNRRRFDEVADAVHAGDVPLPLSLLIIDIDNFKAINDTYSHAAGDQVIREVASIISGECRAGMDTPIRYAGDEFTVFLHAHLADATGIADRIRATVAAADFGHVAAGMSVSVSTGAAVLRAGMSVADLFHLADEKLYEAKRGGRNQVAA
jgi:diguanylate cyclase